MSNGGRESGRDDETGAKKGGGPSGGDDFSRAISRIAVAQICESTGFQGCQRSALDTLADVALRYICGLGKSAHFYANLSGRTDCNVFDIIQGLEDLGVAQGFTSASDVHHCLVSSGVVREITQYVSTAEEVPFARPVPHFPVVRPRKPMPSFVQLGEVPAGKHIPDWLPVFPDPHTYIHTPVYKERETNLRADKVEQTRQRRKAERSLLSLQKRFACNGAAGPVPMEDGDVGKGKRVTDINPFLAPPFPYGEKGVLEIVIPKDDATLGKKVSVLETFAPVIEAAKSGSLDGGSGEKMVLPSKRPTIHFKFGVDKKSVAPPFSSSALVVRTNSWFLRDGEKDDKKRRAEMILKEAMENPEELTQM